MKTAFLAIALISLSLPAFANEKYEGEFIHPRNEFSKADTPEACKEERGEWLESKKMCMQDISDSVFVYRKSGVLTMSVLTHSESGVVCQMEGAAESRHDDVLLATQGKCVVVATYSKDHTSLNTISQDCESICPAGGSFNIHKADLNQ